MSTPPTLLIGYGSLYLYLYGSHNVLCSHIPCLMLCSLVPEKGCISSLFMAALYNRAGHIYFHPMVSSSFFLFFPHLISAVGDWMSTYFHTWCGLSVNLECRSETCCMRLAENTARKKNAKKSPSGHHPTTLSGYIFATEVRIDNRKKLVKQ